MTQPENTTLELIDLGRLASRSLDNLSAPGNTVGREWVASFEQGVRPHVDRCREFAPALPDRGDGEIRDALLDHCLALDEAFSEPSLSAPRIAVAAVYLLLWRVAIFLHEGFALCREAAEAAQAEKLASACQILVDRLVGTAESESPPLSLEDYQSALSLFQVLRAGDPIAQVLSLAYRRVRSVDSRAVFTSEPRGVVASPDFDAALRIEPSLGDIEGLEIATASLRPDLLAQANLPTDTSYRVWYGTNRTPVQPRDIRQGFSATLDTTLHLGSCVVTVPRSHVVGSIGSSWLMRKLILRADDRLTVDVIEESDGREEFLRSISAELSARNGRTALLYVHGFNVTFDEAARRAAQLACDLSVDGVTAFFSWPSAGNLRSYALDGDLASASADQFREFIDLLVDAHGLERIDILAHSMGNRVLAEIVKGLSQSGQRKRIGHLILAAPDISRIKFSTVSDFYLEATSKRVTLYSCARDLALRASTFIHRYSRIGFEPPPYLRAGIDTVSARRLSLDLLGHGYIASARPAIEDLKKLLWQGLEPSKRGLVGQPTAATPAYWLLARE